MTIQSFDHLIQTLGQDQQFVRLKKLLVYACTRTWESQPDRLNQFELGELIEKLWAANPTWEQLQFYLYNLVQTLNKPAEYMLVANHFLTQIQDIYPRQASFAKQNHPPHAYGAIAQQLNQSPDPQRIKKLLLFACKQIWENSPDQLSQVDLTALVQELYELTSDLGHLQQVLFSIVNTLNRRAEYTLVANRMIAIFKQLYDEVEAPVLSASETPDLTEVTGFVQPVVLARPLVKPAPPAAPQPIPQPIPQPVPQPATQLPKPQQTVAPEAGDAAMGAAPSSQAAAKQTQPSLDLFDLRLEIIKYTNPLRAKILICAVVQGQPDWREAAAEALAIAKQHELDDLLLELLKACSTFIDLEAHLKAAIRRLPDPGQYQQVASTLIRVLRPFYAAGEAIAPLVRHSPTTDRTQLRTQFQAATQMGNTALDDDGDQTCQIFSLPTALDAGATSGSGAAPDEQTGLLLPDGTHAAEATEAAATPGKHEQAYQTLLNSIRAIFREE